MKMTTQLTELLHSVSSCVLFEINIGKRLRFRVVFVSFLSYFFLLTEQRIGDDSVHFFDLIFLAVGGSDC